MVWFPSFRWATPFARHRDQQHTGVNTRANLNSSDGWSAISQASSSFYLVVKGHFSLNPLFVSSPRAPARWGQPGVHSCNGLWYLLRVTVGVDGHARDPGSFMHYAHTFSRRVRWAEPNSKQNDQSASHKPGTPYSIAWEARTLGIGRPKFSHQPPKILVWWSPGPCRSGPLFVHYCLSTTLE